ncbi:pterin-4-alpha-carbinolamine dehydratase 2, mitochondrial-like isoform X1 [Zingiber officinale]|uniref:pterin-4-alpha-carbinolamine dehydratase 2, mitochondrial-like isoform X1 n=1 Tax=Zingiber officinale TaxID=94328 RepID=UPI001C4CAC1F|nr:pterin-4-alpha-carbinolamine dehydratase 2, mitochondrial-like isoform X1 [Zingiber officinale]
MNRVLQTRFFSLANVSFLKAASLFADGCSGHGVVKLQQGHVSLPSNRRVVCGFSSCSLSQDLASKKCAPCNAKDLQAMSEQSANELLAQVQGWGLLTEGGILKLHRSWKVKSFTKGLEFFKLVAEIAEAEGHHPDLHLVGWNNVKIDLWTHSVGGLTENDFILAAKINSLKIEHLLKRKTAR